MASPKNQKINKKQVKKSIKIKDFDYFDYLNIQLSLHWILVFFALFKTLWHLRKTRNWMITMWLITMFFLCLATRAFRLWKKRKINFISSDTCRKMIAEKTFSNIIQQVLSSNLNFQLQLSPFSAMISLKKPPVKDILGNIIKPVDSKVLGSDANPYESRKMRWWKNIELKSNPSVWNWVTRKSRQSS